MDDVDAASAAPTAPTFEKDPSTLNVQKRKAVASVDDAVESTDYVDGPNDSTLGHIPASQGSS